MAAAAQQRPGKRTVLGTVQPGESLSVPYGWRSAGKQLQVSLSLRHALGAALSCSMPVSSHAAWHVKCLWLQATCSLLSAGQVYNCMLYSKLHLSLFSSSQLQWLPAAL